MSRRATWMIVLGVGALLVVLGLRYGLGTTPVGAASDDATKDLAVTVAPDGGRNVELRPGGLHVWLPGYPYRTDQDVISPYGTVAFHAVSNDGPRISCTASWADRAKNDDRTDVAIFEETATALAQSVGGHVLATKATSLGTYAGREIRLSATKPRVGSNRIRVYVLGPRIYSMTVFMMPGAEIDREIDRFFDSLAIADDGGILRPAQGPPPVQPDLHDVYVSMTQESPPGTIRTLLVHEDGVVELVTGRDGPVARRTSQGVADLAPLRRLFGGPAWRALAEEPDGGASMYAIASGGRTVHRADPLTKVEPVFVEAIGALGPLWIYAERGERPGAAP